MFEQLQVQLLVGRGRCGGIVAVSNETVPTAHLPSPNQRHTLLLSAMLLYSDRSQSFSKLTQALYF